MTVRFYFFIYQKYGIIELYIFRSSYEKNDKYPANSIEAGKCSVVTAKENEDNHGKHRFRNEKHPEAQRNNTKIIVIL